ncbi:MAG: hypothetical protein QXE80_03705 [Pyrobaculum sp.]
MHGRIIAVANELITIDQLEGHRISIFEQLRCFEPSAYRIRLSDTMNDDVANFAEFIEQYGASVSFYEPDVIDELPYTEDDKVYMFYWDKQSLQELILQKYKEFVRNVSFYSSNTSFENFAANPFMHDIKTKILGTDNGDLVAYINNEDALLLSFVGFAKSLFNNTIKQPLYIVGSYDYQH